VPTSRRWFPWVFTAATVIAGNTVDVVLERLRAWPGVKLAGEDVQAAYESEKDTCAPDHHGASPRRWTTIRKIQNEKAIAQDDCAAVAKAVSTEFWDRFSTATPIRPSSFLENRIAPLASDADMLFLALPWHRHRRLCQVL